MRFTTTRTTALIAVLGLGLAACGSDEDTSTDDTTDTAEAGRTTEAPGTTAASSAPDTTVATETPTVVVTTNILGDVVAEVVGDAAEVVAIMPVGADPHNFQASAQEIDTLMNADAVIVNGADFEEGLLDVIENAVDEGIPTFEAISVVEMIDFSDGGHDHSDDEDDDHDEDHSDESDHDHDHSGADPHFFTDPMRMALAVDGLVDFLQAEIDVADPAALDASAAGYVAELTALDAEVEASLASIPDERRVLVTNHEVFGYFADRYGFEIVGAVIPGGGTADSVSAGELAALAELIEAEGVPAIFADTSSPDELVQTLAGEVGDVAVVELYSESLGGPDSDGATYLAMVRTNGERISTALS